MKKTLLIIVVGFVSNISCAQGLTLGGLGAGGLNGNGFGDPIANDYVGIDWGYDFQTGMIINGNDPYKARMFANSMIGNNFTASNVSQVSNGYWQSREPEMDAYFRMRWKNRMYRDREARYIKYKSSGAYLIMSFDRYEAEVFAARNNY